MVYDLFIRKKKLLKSNYRGDAIYLDCNHYSRIIFDQWWALSYLPYLLVSVCLVQVETILNRSSLLNFFFYLSPDHILGISAVSTIQGNSPFFSASFFVSEFLWIFFLSLEEGCLECKWCFTYFDCLVVVWVREDWEVVPFLIATFWGWVCLVFWLFWVTFCWLWEVDFLNFLSSGWELERGRGAILTGRVPWSS